MAARAKSRAEETPPDLAGVMERAHFAFRALGTGYVGKHTTYTVQASDEALRVTPLGTGSPGATLELARAAIRRGDSSLPAAALTLGRDGTLGRAFGDVRETVENRASGVELSWSFARRPVGAGALEVRLRTAGLEPSRVTRGGVQLKAARGGPGVRIGHGTWVDANGVTTPVLATLSGRDVVFSVPAAVLEASQYPAVLDPIVGPENAIDVPVTSPAAGDREIPSLASSGSQSFAVWSDLRGEGLVQLFGTRISSAGVALDPLGIAVSP
ncbi:MAG TPA: hypothetical protein VNN72_10160, partial [Polyangiaceae bacterium]|nr:hypothetical protein [Polyangiaceae bacterium]